VDRKGNGKGMENQDGMEIGIRLGNGDRVRISWEGRGNPMFEFVVAVRSKQMRTGRPRRGSTICMRGENNHSTAYGVLSALPV
jgi:hypothetical protein